MNNREITQAYHKKYGIRQIKGAPMVEGEIAPLLPFFLHDAAYDYYRHNLRPVNWFQESEYHRNKIEEAYKEFADLLTNALTLDQQNYIGDKMTAMEELLRQDLFLTEVAYQNCFIGDADSDQQKILGGVLMLGNLAKLAADCFAEIYGMGLLYKIQGRSLNAIRFHTRELGKILLKEWHIPDRLVPEKYAYQLDQAGNAFLRKLSKWIEQERGLAVKQSA